MTFRTFLSVVLLAPALQAGVITVGPSGAFSDIQPAIDAAQPGDVLLVEPGSYSPFVLAKPLRIYAQPGAVIELHPGLQAEVTGIAAGEEAVIHGLKLGTCVVPPGATCLSPFAGDCFSMSVHDNAGTVLLQSLDSYGISVSSSELVIVADSTLFGRKLEGCGAGTAAGPGYALQLSASEVWVVGSILDGGSGGGTFPALAGTGILALHSAVYIAESTVRGGNGGMYLGSCTGAPALLTTDGKPGIEASGSSVIKVVSGPGQAIMGGNGGASLSCADGDGASAVILHGSSQLLVVDSIQVSGGTTPGVGSQPPIQTFDSAKATTTALTYPLLSGPSSVSLGGAVSLVASGNPGAGVRLFLSLGVGPATFIPGIDGKAALDASSLMNLGHAVLDPAGLATFAVAVPPHPVLVGILGAFQAVEVGGPQAAFSNPVFSAVFP